LYWKMASDREIELAVFLFDSSFDSNRNHYDCQRYTLDSFVYVD